MTSALCGNLSEVLDEANKDTYRITIPHSYPPYLLLPSEGSAVFPKQLLNDGVKDEKSAYRPLVLYRGPDATYWNAGPGFNGTKVCATHTDCPVFQKEDENKCCERDIQMFLFVDKLFPSLLNSVVKGGIIAMYVVVVLVAANAIRNVFVGAPLDVIIKEMPNVDRLLKICLDIYLVREARDFVLEQDIYAKLLFLFRSPETLIKWTRPLPEKAKED